MATFIRCPTECTRYKDDVAGALVLRTTTHWPWLIDVTRCSGIDMPRSISTWPIVCRHPHHQGHTHMIFLPGEGHRRRKGSVVGGGTMATAEHEPMTGVWGQSPQRGPGAEPLVRESGWQSPLSWKHFGHWMSNGAGTDSLNNNCICISTLGLGATVMIWENFMSKSRGVRWLPLPLPGGAHAHHVTHKTRST